MKLLKSICESVHVIELYCPWDLPKKVESKELKKKKWYDPPEYSEIIDLRFKSANTKILIDEGNQQH